MYCSKRHLYLFIKIVIVGIVFFTQFTSLAQQKNVTGLVTDRQIGQTMHVVNVLVKGTTSGTISGANDIYIKRLKSSYHVDSKRLRKIKEV